jgi:hypothetical protein
MPTGIESKSVPKTKGFSPLFDLWDNPTFSSGATDIGETFAIEVLAKNWG